MKRFTLDNRSTGGEKLHFFLSFYHNLLNILSLPFIFIVTYSSIPFEANFMLKSLKNSKNINIHKTNNNTVNTKRNTTTVIKSKTPTRQRQCKVCGKFDGGCRFIGVAN
jgi:hypothetical protein